MHTEYAAPLGGMSYTYAELKYFDKFDTNETWMFYFWVRPAESQDKAWSLFQNLMDSLSNVTQFAMDEGAKWEYANTDPVNGYEYTVYAILKSR